MSYDTLESFYEVIASSRSRLDSFVVLPDGSVKNPLSYFDLPNMGHRGMNNGIFAVVPGSFNPLHDAHKFIYDKIYDTIHPNTSLKGISHLVKPITKVFEISINRLEKPYLSLEELRARLEQFKSYAPVWVTNASFFFEKAGLVSYWIRPTFFIGFDTAQRLVDHHGIAGVQGIQADFIVSKRYTGGQVCSLETIQNMYYATPKNMFDSSLPIDDSLLRLSSTAIRNGTK